MKNKIKIICHWGLIFLGLGLFGLQKAPIPVRAQIPSQLTISVSPVNQYIWLKPGESTTLEFTLQNTSDLNLIFNTDLASFEATGINGEIELIELPEENQLILSPIEQNENALPAASQKIINLKITAPLSAKNGEYYYSLIIKTDLDPADIPTYETDISTTQLQANLVSNFIILVAPTRADQSQLTWSRDSTTNSVVFWQESWGALAQLWQQHENFKLIATNNGTTSTILKGQIEIINLQNNQLVANYQIEPSLILPKRDRQLRFFVSENEDSAIFPYFKDKFLFGRYQIKIIFYSAHDLNQNPPLIINYEIQFWPWGITIVLLGLAASIVAIIIIKRQLKKNRLRRARSALIALNQKKL